MSYTPAQLRRVRRALAVAPRGHMLGLDEVVGITRVRVLEFAGDGEGLEYSMLRASALVEVWTAGSHDHVLDAIGTNAPAGVLVLPIVRSARARHRFAEWSRWSRWLVAYFAIRWLRRLGLVSQARLRRSLNESDALAARRNAPVGRSGQASRARTPRVSTR